MIAEKEAAEKAETAKTDEQTQVVHAAREAMTSPALTDDIVIRRSFTRSRRSKMTSQRATLSKNSTQLLSRVL